MTEQPPKPPFDPVWGAWIVLLIVLFGLYSQLVFNFIGCAVFHEPTICAFTGSNVKEVTLELIAMLAILIGAKR